MSSSTNLPSLTVHHLHIAQSERIVFLCEELGIPYDLKLYTRAPIYAPADLKALTPAQSAPVITTTNLVTGKEFNMSESGAIAEYINTVYGNGKLAVTPDKENYPEYVYWFHVSNASLGPAMSRIMTANLTDPERKSPMTQYMFVTVRKHLSALNTQLEKTKAWIVGEQFTLADIMISWSLGTGRQWFGPLDLSDYPAIVAYMERLGRRESYARFMAKAEEGLDWKKGLSPKGPELFGGLQDMLKSAGIDTSKL
jgi:glutathione S-transferase